MGRDDGNSRPLGREETPDPHFCQSSLPVLVGRGQQGRRVTMEDYPTKAAPAPQVEVNAPCFHSSYRNFCYNSTLRVNVAQVVKVVTTEQQETILDADFVTDCDVLRQRVIGECFSKTCIFIDCFHKACPGSRYLKRSPSQVQARVKRYTRVKRCKRF